MSKFKGKKEQRHGNNNNNASRFTPDIMEFAKWTTEPNTSLKDAFKKYRKKTTEYYNDKKEAKIGFYEYLTDRLPDVIEFLLKEGYKAEKNNDAEITNIVRAIYVKLVDSDYVRFLKKKIKDDQKIRNIKLYPIIIKNIIDSINSNNKAILNRNKDGDTYSVDDIVELSGLILKKKIKKMKKDGVDVRIAFDALSCIPCEDAFKYSQGYRVSSFFTALYERAKNDPIPFATIMDNLTDSVNYPVFILFSLLERKERFANLTEGQKKLYLSISNWCFDTMENMRIEDTRDIIESYVAARKRDDKNGKDSARRYTLSSLSETDYPKISKIIRGMITDDENLKRYL